MSHPSELNVFTLAEKQKKNALFFEII